MLDRFDCGLGGFHRRLGQLNRRLGRSQLLRLTRRRALFFHFANRYVNARTLLVIRRSIREELLIEVDGHLVVFGLAIGHRDVDQDGRDALEHVRALQFFDRQVVLAFGVRVLTELVVLLRLGGDLRIFLLS